MRNLFLLLPLVGIVGCSGCTGGLANGNATVLVEGRQTEANQKRISADTPPPQFDHSLERENLIRRLKLLNVQNKVMYLYCLSMDGKIVKEGLVQGKVSSLNSFLTTPQQVVYVGGAGDNKNGSWVTLPSPDFDGSYGDNPKGIFWFSPDGAYHEWAGGDGATYYLSDRPEKVNTPVSLTATVDVEKK